VDVVKAVRRFDIVLVNLDPTVGLEIQKTRPCLVVSPDEVNRHLRTVIVAPMTTTARPYPTRVAIRFQRKDGQVALDQLRTVDKARLAKRLGAADRNTAAAVCAVLVEMFTLE
jgi:mRNA interferase MazF